MSKRRKKSRREPAGPPDLPNVRLTVEPDRLEVVYSRKRWGGLFVLVFACFWVRASCQFVAGLFRHEWGYGEVFAVGVLASVNLLLLFFILCCFFHRERLRIDSSGLDWRFTAIFPVRRRKVSWEQLVAFQRGYDQGERQLIRSWGCQVETTNRMCGVFLDMSPYSDGAELRCFLQQFITKYREANTIATPISVIAKKRKQLQAAEIARKQALVENRWTLRDDGSGTMVYERRGWVSLVTSAKLLGICLFWNGGVSIFVAVCITSIAGVADNRKFPPALGWAMAVFLIPFVLIGLMIFSITAMTILQYFCRYKITIDETGVRYRRSWFGIGRTRFWSHANAVRISILRDRKDYAKWWNNTKECVRNPEFADSFEGKANDNSYAIHFADGSNDTDKKRPSQMIRNLYEKEARAIAARIRAMKPT